MAYSDSNWKPNVADLVSAMSFGNLRVCIDTTPELAKSLPKATFWWFFVIKLFEGS